MTRAAPIPSDEPERLDALRRYGLLDTAEDEVFDRLTRIAATALGTPIALMSLVDADRQWFKSRVGLAERETPRDAAFCGHAILQDDVMVVDDARADPRFADNPLVTGAPHIRFYAGAPLVTPEGHRLGTICAIDDRPRTLTPEQTTLLVDLAAIAMDELELRRLVRHADGANQFVATLSHEVRNPLSAVIGLAEQIRVSTPNGPAADAAVAIETAALDLLDVLNGVLDQAKMAHGELRLDVGAFDLAAKLAKAEALYGHRARAKGLTLIVDPPPPGVERLFADRHRLRQILFNLISNALKFTAAGSIRVQSELTPNADGRALLTVRVIDTGPGMSADEAARVFEPFVQGEASARGHGVGLGLAISRQLARAMGGDIVASSVPGRGSTFTLSVPVEIDPSVPTRATRPARVLVLDDHDGHRRLMQTLIGALGHQCETAENASMALQRLNAHDYDLLLIDRRLPDMAGPMFLTVLRASGRRNADIPAVAFSGDDRGALEAAFAGHDIRAFITKPVDPAYLASVIAAVDPR